MVIKIALITCHEVTNYGSMLQSYALQMKIDQFGLDSENINYHPVKDYSYYKSLLYKLCNAQLWKWKLATVRKNRQKKNDSRLDENLKIREKAFKRFADKYFRLSKPLVGYNELSNYANNYSLFILGSDQVWGPMNLEGNYTNMMFIPDHIPKITYAPSFGVTSIPKNQIKRTKIYLSRIHHLSVRELQGKKIINQLTGREASVVLDPTLLFNAKEWLHIQPKHPVVDGPYIFTYFLGHQDEYRQAVKRLKEKTGYPIVSLIHIDGFVEADIAFADFEAYDVDPGDFVNLIKNATYVCTDSFHGTVFSVLNNKKFVTFKRYKESSVLSANSRVENLLMQIKLTDRFYNSESFLKDIDNEILYNSVDQQLKILRNDSLSYLINALNQCNIEVTND